jgi:hypothetical protein
MRWLNLNLNNTEQLIISLAVLAATTALAVLHILDSSVVIAVISALVGGNLFAHGFKNGVPVTPITPITPIQPAATLETTTPATTPMHAVQGGQQ